MPKKTDKATPFLFEVRYKITERSHSLAVCGSSPDLGMWDVTKSVIARNFPPGSEIWVASIHLKPHLHFFWKWVVVDNTGTARTSVRWEERPQREFYSGVCPTRLKSQWNGGLEMDIHYKYKYNHIGIELTEDEGEEELSACILPSRDVFLSLTEEVSSNDFNNEK